MPTYECAATATVQSSDASGNPINITLVCDTPLTEHVVVVNHHDPNRGDWGDYLRSNEMPMPDGAA
jgi:hypothetical protein